MDADIRSSVATVTVEGTGYRFAAGWHEPVLDSALRAGVPLPHQCRGASCGTCKCEVLAGEVEHGWSLGLGITEEEQEAGYCPACQAQPRSSHLHLRPVQPMSGSLAITQHEAIVIASVAETPRVRRLELALPAGRSLGYRPGMYAELLLPDIAPDRRYSFVSPDRGDGLLTFWIALHPHGRASGHVHEALRAGDRVGLRGPLGNCALPPADPADAGPSPVLALAAGTGLAPVHAILADALERGLSEPVSLLCSVREHAELLGLAELERLARRHPNFRFAYTATDSPSPLAAHARLIPELLPELHPDLRRHRLLISGAPGFVEACAARAVALGADPQRISSDSFTPVG